MSQVRIGPPSWMRRAGESVEDWERRYAAEEDLNTARTAEMSIRMRTGRIADPEDLQEARRLFGYGARADSNYNPLRW